jgi:hypothetical protein
VGHTGITKPWLADANNARTCKRRNTSQCMEFARSNGPKEILSKGTRMAGKLKGIWLWIWLVTGMEAQNLIGSCRNPFGQSSRLGHSRGLTRLSCWGIPSFPPATPFYKLL